MHRRMAESESCCVVRFPAEGGVLLFMDRFLLGNKPCLFGPELTRDWKARQLWQIEGKPNLGYLSSEFGDAEVPVADCSREEFGAHPKREMRVAEFLDYWRTEMTSRTSAAKEEGGCSKGLLYLKDWHLVREFPCYNAYTVPKFFTSDWLNEVWDTRTDVKDDYRFVYMGPRGTWTPFHADVFRSYSWSANVCGRKEWLLYPPGEEELLKDKLGNLPFDVTCPELQDGTQYPNASRARPPIRVLQEAGEIIFIPSGWHHQVRNTEDTISINHNWTNGFGLFFMWKHLQRELGLVRRELSDCRTMENWEQQCQVVLRASAGMDYCQFEQFLLLLAVPRLQHFVKVCGDHTFFKDLEEMISEIATIEWTLLSRDELSSFVDNAASSRPYRLLEGVVSESCDPSTLMSLSASLPLRIQKLLQERKSMLSSCETAELTLCVFELHRISFVLQSLFQMY